MRFLFLDLFLLLLLLVAVARTEKRRGKTKKKRESSRLRFYTQFGAVRYYYRIETVARPLPRSSSWLFLCVFLPPLSLSFLCCPTGGPTIRFVITYFFCVAAVGSRRPGGNPETARSSATRRRPTTAKKKKKKATDDETNSNNNNNNNEPATESETDAPPPPFVCPYIMPPPPHKTAAAAKKAASSKTCAAASSSSSSSAEEAGADDYSRRRGLMVLLFRRSAQLLLCAVCASYLSTCPHAKVEESFNLQAAHDLLYYNYDNLDDDDDRSKYYDHLRYPGVVPRTFLGSLLLAGGCQLTRLVLFAMSFGRLDLLDFPMSAQFLSRFALLAATVAGWFRLASAVDDRLLLRSRRSASGSSRTTPSRRSDGGNLAATTATATTTITGTYLLLVAACQFHVPFYSSRTLPNVFAAAVSLQAFAYWISAEGEGEGDDRSNNKSANTASALALLVFDAVVFRCDVVLLLAPIGLVWLATGRIDFRKAAKVGLTTAAVSLIATVPIDSWFWRRPVWPEGEVLYYNTVLNKSSDWGVSPWYWYWTSALPKSLQLTALAVPLAAIRLPELLSSCEGRFLRGERVPSIIAATFSSFNSSLWFDRTWMPQAAAAFGFVALYSFLGHKEVRFLFPVLPLFNLLSAVGFARIHEQRFPSSKAMSSGDDDTKKPVRFVSKLLFAGAVSALVASLAGSTVFVAVSRWNYPGGEALRRLSEIVAETKPDQVRVYVDVASAMTGVSKFGERAARTRCPGTNWTIHKAGYESENAMALSDDGSGGGYTHILSENKDIVGSDEFRVLTVVRGNPKLDFRRFKIITADAIYVLGRIR